MRQPQHTQRGALQRLQDRPQEAPDKRPAGDDVIVSAEYHRASHEAQWQPGEQALQAPPRIGAHMWDKAVPPARRQVIDQGYIAKAVAPAPVDAVGFEGIAPVGDKERQASLRFQDTHYLDQGGPVVSDVLEHLVAEDQVEALRRKRQALASRVEDAFP